MIDSKVFASLLAVSIVGCVGSYRTDLDYSYAVEQTFVLDDLSTTSELAQFESVPLDLVGLSKLEAAIVDDGLASGRDVLQIGTGTGVISLLCVHHGANRVVATDVFPAAIANTRYNAAQLDMGANLEVRFHSKDQTNAFSPVDPNERFDLILFDLDRQHFDLANPTPQVVQAKFSSLLESLLAGLQQHLNVGGRLVLTTGHQDRIKMLDLLLATDQSLLSKKLDDRLLADLPDSLSPSTLIEVRIRQLTPEGATSTVPATSSQ